jgi:hypothetical protein
MLSISTMLVAWVVIDSLFVATLKYLAFQRLHARETVLPIGSKP